MLLQRDSGSNHMNSLSRLLITLQGYARWRILYTRRLRMALLSSSQEGHLRILQERCRPVRGG